MEQVTGKEIIHALKSRLTALTSGKEPVNSEELDLLRLLLDPFQNKEN